MLRNCRERPRRPIVKGVVPQLEVNEFTIEGPFDGPDPHTHADHTDAFYVLEGEVEFHVDGRAFRAGPGTFVAAPPGTLHGFADARAGDGAVPRTSTRPAPASLDAIRRIERPRRCLTPRAGTDGRDCAEPTQPRVRIATKTSWPRVDE